jgi:hypothetical protein
VDAVIIATSDNWHARVTKPRKLNRQLRSQWFSDLGEVPDVSGYSQSQREGDG